MLVALDLPVRLDARDRRVVLREADPVDLDGIVDLIANDPVSAARGDTARPEDRAAYAAALSAIRADPSNAQLVAESEGELVGTLQLTVIPGLARAGAARLQVETVRVREDMRSSGIGGAMMRWVEQVAAPTLGASIVQLTSDAARVDAHRFYERLGYAASHVGYKLAVR